MAAHRNAMDPFGDDKMKAMEEEMSRFEQEISGGPGDGPPSRPHGYPGIPGMVPPSRPPGATVSVPGMTATTVGHSRQQSMTATLQGFVTKPQMLTSVRPEVGPQLPTNFHRPTAPAFVPHQIRPMPHYGGYHPPPPRMMHPGPPGPMHRPPMMRPPMMRPTVISAPPTVYSAKPVKFVKKKEETKEEASASTEGSSEGSAVTTKAPEVTTAAAPPQQAPPMPTPVMAAHHGMPPRGMPPGQGMPPMVPNHPAMAPYMMHGGNPAMHMQGVPPGMPQQQGGMMMEELQEAGTSQESAEDKKKDKKKKKKFVRIAANETWEDDSLAEWDPNDFRIFCGDIGNEVTDELLTKVFCKYPSFLKAKVVREKRTNKTKGYGFVSFKDPGDFANAMRELNGKYVGNRPIKLRKSNWKDRNIDIYKKKNREKQRLGLR